VNQRSADAGSGEAGWMRCEWNSRGGESERLQLQTVGNGKQALIHAVGFGVAVHVHAVGVPGGGGVLDVFAYEVRGAVGEAKLSAAGMVAAGRAMRLGISLERSPVDLPAAVEHQGVGSAGRITGTVGRSENAPAIATVFVHF